MRLFALLSLWLAVVAQPAAADEILRLATTTSTENSGLLAVLLPPFERRFGVAVHVVAVGSGAALELGENGDVDLVMSHAPELEDRFIAAGFGVNRRELMYNDFVLLGPPADPAGIGGSVDAAAALQHIATAKAPFLSRGDRSGTHLKEQALWRAAGMIPGGDWYREAGRGMGAVLAMADELEAYTLADRGTYLAMRDKLHLRVVAEGDARLRNPYVVIAVNPARHPEIRYVMAMALIGYLTSPEGQRRIAEFTVGGQPLFRPLAVP